MMPIRRMVVLLVALALLAAISPVYAATPDALRSRDGDWSARQIRTGGLPARDRALARTLPGRATMGYHPGTGRVRAISGTPRRPLAEGVAAVAAGRRALSAADARGQARRFVERYGPLFGLTSPERELRVRATRRALAAPGGSGQGRERRPGATVRFDQFRDGVAVMGGELVVQLSGSGEVISVSGEVLPSGARSGTDPAIPLRRARKTAAAWLARMAGRPQGAVVTRSEGLALYDPRIMDDPVLAAVGRRLVWRIDARLPSAGRPEHRLVLVDALGGQVLNAINRLPRIERRVCDNRNQPGRSYTCTAPYARSEGEPPTGGSDVDAAYELMGATYDYFFALFGRDGVDGRGSRIKATVRHCPYGCPWNNAAWHWAQQQAVFGRGWARADDIVGHEYTHGVLDAEAPLFYQYQSGAINESYADVFGELIDQAWPGGRDTLRSRWKIGEDTPVGAIRDMRDPARFGHPDRVRSPRWHTSTSDDGGVHRNSGVGNKAASLMADGGTFRGQDIEAIGATRTARVWYQALTTRLTSAANYVDLFDALNAACTDLAGSADMTLAHCKTVRQATVATQMHRQPRPLAPATAPLCPAGRAPLDVFFDDLEDPAAGNWIPYRLWGSKKGWFYPQNPNASPGWDGSWSSSGRHNFYAPNYGSRSDTAIRMRDAVRLPPQAFLRFEHGFSFDRDARRRYDGGIVEIKVDDGAWRGVGGRFTHGKYNGRIAASRGNPLKGKRAWTGDSRGWSAARVDLSSFAGSLVKVRFRMGADRTVGARGWYVDDIRIYTCTDDEDKPTGTITINGGEDGTTSAQVSLGLTWDDASTWVTKLRLSASPEMNAAGVALRHGVNMPVRETVAWDLADTTFGGDGGDGVRTVYAQVRDAAGNWSDVFSDEIELLR